MDQMDGAAARRGAAERGVDEVCRVGAADGPPRRDVVRLDDDLLPKGAPPGAAAVDAYTTRLWVAYIGRLEWPTPPGYARPIGVPVVSAAKTTDMDLNVLGEPAAARL